MRRPVPAAERPDVSRIRPAGAIQAAAFVAVLAVLPFITGQHWQVNLLVFTVMYAGLAGAWNILGGYAGYPALGHAAFFGVGAYAMAIGTTSPWCGREVTGPSSSSCPSPSAPLWPYCRSPACCCGRGPPPSPC